MGHQRYPKVLQTKSDFDDFFYSTPYLAFLDILGFKTLVQKNSHHTLVNLYNTLFSSHLDNVAGLYKEHGRKKSERLGEKYTDSGMQMINISDSILIWTKHGQPSALIEIISAVQTLLATSLAQGLPLRGCITRNPFAVLEKDSVTSIIGKGLVHASEIEKAQEWSGCAIDNEIVNYGRSIERYVYDKERPSEIEAEGLVIGYDIPIKNNKTIKGFAFDWSESLISDEMITNAFNAP